MQPLFYYWLGRRHHLNTSMSLNLTVIQWDCTSGALSEYAGTTSSCPCHCLLHVLAGWALQIQLIPTLARVKVEFEWPTAELNAAAGGPASSTCQSKAWISPTTEHEADLFFKDNCLS